MKVNKDIRLIYVDLFCGAGGVTTGVERARKLRSKIAKVVACVNHDPLAILSHEANHKDVLHFIEDIRDLDLTKLLMHLNYMRVMYPNAKVVIWISAECTNHSNAKGGLPKDADSRTLPNDCIRYIEAINPDYIQVENVREFLDWGPLRIKYTAETETYCTLKTHTVKKTGEHVYSFETIQECKKLDYIKWRDKIKSMGYDYDYRLLNAADFGAHTSRIRYFGVFAKNGLPISFPAPTHAKKPKAGSRLKKWRAVREVLDLDNEGESILNRVKNVKSVRVAKKLLESAKKCKSIRVTPVVNNGVDDLVITADNLNEFDSLYNAYTDRNGPVKMYYLDPLSENTLKRVHAGLVKFVAGGKDKFIAKQFSGRPAGKVISVDGPAGTITTVNGQSLVSTEFLSRYYSGSDSNRNHSLEEPAGTITTENRLALVKADWLLKYLSNNQKTGVNKGASIDQPAPTITTHGRLALVEVSYLKQNKESPSPQFLTKYHSNGENIASINNPAPTLPTKDSVSLISANWLDMQFSQGQQNKTIEDPAGSITTVPKLNLVSVNQGQFLDKQYSGPENNQSLQQPSGSLMTNDKHCLISATGFILSPHFLNAGSDLDDPLGTITANKKYHCIINPSWFGHVTSAEDPCVTIVASQHKSPLYLMAIDREEGVIIPILETDCEWTIRIKEFMVLYNIIDIKMRMLIIKELKRITGFGEDYVLKGTQTDQKRFIGNAVPCIIPQRMAECLVDDLIENELNEAA